MILFLDFETYFDSDYSLSKMPALQYLRDERFKCLGCAVKVNNNPSKWVEAERLPKLFAAIDWSKTLLVAHNINFDGLLLKEIYGYQPALYYCTSASAYYFISQGIMPTNTPNARLATLAELVEGKKGDIHKDELTSYALNDVDLCAKLFFKYYPLMPADERYYLHMHALCSCVPQIELEEITLQGAVDRRENNKERAAYLRKEVNFAQELRILGVEPEYKVTDKGTKKLAIAKKDNFTKRLQAHADPRVRDLISERLDAGSTSDATKAERYLNIGSPISLPLYYFGAHTGRSTGADKLNPQAMQRTGAVRSSLKAPAGYKFLVCDSSQIEPRTLAYLSGDTLLQNVLKQKDIYRYYGGTYMFHKNPEDVTPQERQLAKSAIIALGYGQGKGGFINYCLGAGLQISEDEANLAVSTYRSTFRQAVAYSKQLMQDIIYNGVNILPTGRRLLYENLKLKDGEYVYSKADIFARKKLSQTEANEFRIWHGLAVENAVQAAARDIVFSQAAIACKRWGQRIPLVLLVHDEAVFLVPDGEADERRSELEETFKIPPSWLPELFCKGEAKLMEYYTK